MSTDKPPLDVGELRQAWPRPSHPRPIVVIGSGGIVNDAHLPAYRLANLPVAGVYDLDLDKARAVAAKWGTRAFETPDEAIATPGAVFDLALPPAAHLDVLPKLPDGAAVLLQKPMGRDLDEASAILKLCRANNLTAAVNFQLRFSPMLLAVADALERGWLGRLIDVEVHLNLVTPWHLFPFLKGMPRVEIAVHSIHYLDTLRALLGNPTGVHARTMGHPSTDLAQTRTSAIFDFGPDQRVTVSINHNHDFGRDFQDASFRIEGTKGAAMLKLGLLLNYPEGEPDELWINSGGSGWTKVPLSGRWFPHAFIGTMSNLQRFAAGEDTRLLTSVEDAWGTMAMAEAAFVSAAQPATQVRTKP
jgi:predicted dehydrogenase